MTAEESVARLQADVGVQESEIKEFKSKVKQLSDEVERLSKFLAGSEKKKAEAEKSVEALKEDVADKGGEIKELQRTVDKLNKQHSANTDSLTAELKRTTDKLSAELQTALEKSAAHASAAAEEKTKLETQLEKLRLEISKDLKPKIAEFEDRNKMLEASLRNEEIAKDSSLQELAAQLAARESERNKLEKRIAELEVKLRHMQQARQELDASSMAAVDNFEKERAQWEKTKSSLETQIEELTAELDDRTGEVQIVKVQVTKAQRACMDTQKVLDESLSKQAQVTMLEYQIYLRYQVPMSFFEQASAGLIHGFVILLFEGFVFACQHCFDTVQCVAA